MTRHDLLWQGCRVLWRFWARLPGRCQCNICGGKFKHFLPYRGGSRYLPPLIRELNVVGSDVDHFECPCCGSTDRERHLAFYLTQKNLLNLMRGSRILHIAPERHLEKRIRDAQPEEYILGDLHPSRTGVQRLDIQALPFEDGRFEFLIANHVLEHVSDDGCALQEIARVLKPGGSAIIQTPFSNVLQRRFEDAGIRTNRARLHAYGQADHMRLYGSDWIQFFEMSGMLHYQSGAHAQKLSHIDGDIFGFNEAEPFMWFVRAVNA